MKISVIGTGYLGAVHAAGMAYLGHDVLGADIDARKITDLAAGRAPFFEPGLPELLASALSSGRLKFTTSLTEAARFGDVHFICVGTPQERESNRADLSFVDAVIDAMATEMKFGALVVGKSTVPVGTAGRLQMRIDALRGGPGEVEVAWNPEFLREGFAIEDTLHPDRIVVGTSSAHAADILKSFYSTILEDGTPFIATDLPTAELVKVAANSFLATKISFINAMAEVCEAAGADVTTLATAIGHDSRIGSKFLRAGVGFGGGCLGKDIRAFRARGEELGTGKALAFLDEVDAINTRRRHKTIALASEMLGGSLVGRRIAVLGAAFKPESDDVRDSPALWVARHLFAEGARVRVHDPEAIDNAAAAAPELEYSRMIEDAVSGAELIVHLTEWSQYADLDPQVLGGQVATAQLLEARNTLDVRRWIEAGWHVRALGRARGVTGGSAPSRKYSTPLTETIPSQSKGEQYV